MAGTPYLKVYTPGKKYVAACKHASDAAALASLHGPGSTVRYGHRVKDTVWTEGEEEVEAGESYDRAAATIIGRVCDLTYP